MKSHHALSLRVALVIGLAATIALTAGRALADPLPNQIIKFQQLPLDGGVVLPGAYAGPYFNTNGLPPGVPSTAPFPGHDEISTAYLSTAANPVWTGQFMADDFADQFTSPVVHVRWWGSYMNQARFTGVKQFLISFESDVPAVTGGFSHPGTPLLNQIVTLAPAPLAAASGTFTEAIVSPPAAPNPADGPLFQYNAELKNPFFENINAAGGPQPNTIYWLKIVALVNPAQDGQIQWGWHDRDWSIPDPLASVPPAVVPGEHNLNAGTTLPAVWHFQDDAVSGSVTVTLPAGSSLPTVDQSGYAPHNYSSALGDGPTSFIDQYSKDLAFELFTPVPEPASVVLLGLGGLALVAAKRRRNRQ